MPKFNEFIKGFEEKPEQPEKDELFDKYKALGHDNTTAELLANDERERNNPENKRLEKVAQQRVEQGIDAKPLDPQHIKSTGYLGFGSPEKLEEASKPKPKQQPLSDDIETPEQKYSKGYAPNMTYGQAQKAYQEGKISHSDLMRVWHQGGYAKKSLEQAEKNAEKYLKEKRMRPGSDPVTTPKEQLNVHQPKEAPNPKEEPLFDEYRLSTEKGIEEAKNFLDAKGVKDIYALNNEQFDALADEAAKKYGIDRALAEEFLVAPYGEEISKPQPKPKQGTFAQVFGGDNEPRMLYVVYDTPRGKVGDYIELEPDMSEDDIIEQLKENKNVVGVYGGVTNVGAIDPKWERE